MTLLGASLTGTDSNQGCVPARLSRHVAAAVLDAFRPLAAAPAAAPAGPPKQAPKFLQGPARAPAPAPAGAHAAADAAAHAAALAAVCGRPAGAAGAGPAQLCALALLRRLLRAEPGALPALRQAGARARPACPARWGFCCGAGCGALLSSVYAWRDVSKHSFGSAQNARCLAYASTRRSAVPARLPLPFP